MPRTDRDTLDALFTAAYGELRRLAAQVRRDHPTATINPTALVHEAWEKLARSPDFEVTSPLHFRRIAARAMRQVLVEAARQRHAAKRGGRDTALVTFDDELSPGQGSAGELLALDAAMVDLARLAPRQAAVVEARYFGGLSVEEVAETLTVSEATVLRDWRAARAWLAAELGPTAA
jgi:RNA polymerase sigma factor (TIGR02999 family)